MKIVKVETFTYWISWCNWLFVRVETDEGLYGWGEGSLHGAVRSVETAVHELADTVLIGEDPAGVERHWQRMYHAWRWRGGPTLMTAVGALDMALWDIEGKRLGVPVYCLLGGPYRERLRGYASHWLADATTPEDAYENAQEAVRRGFTGFKWSPFKREALRENESRAIAHAAELMAAAREGAGPETDIFVECAELLSPRTAAMVDEALAPYRPGWLEEPIPHENAAAMGRLQREITTPIATGERLLTRWEFLELLEHGGCKIIQPDLMHAGGISEVRRIASLADTYYIPVAPHNPGGPICMLAAMHLAAAIPNFYILEQMEAERPLRDALCTEPVRYQDGYFYLSAGPGWGTDLRLDVLRQRDFLPQPSQRCGDSLWT
ncbi:MAG: galactonate dehydratase [Anaerolineae bacterium]|jgi:galactonate dehydratase